MGWRLLVASVRINKRLGNNCATCPARLAVPSFEPTSTSTLVHLSIHLYPRDTRGSLCSRHCYLLSFPSSSSPPTPSRFLSPFLLGRPSTSYLHLRLEHRPSYISYSACGPTQHLPHPVRCHLPYSRYRRYRHYCFFYRHRQLGSLVKK